MESQIESSLEVSVMELKQKSEDCSSSDNLICQ